MEKEQFFVWRGGTYPPTIYDSFEAAEDAAQNTLVRARTRAKVYILKSVATVEYEEKPLKITMHGEQK